VTSSQTPVPAFNRILTSPLVPSSYPHESPLILLSFHRCHSNITVASTGSLAFAQRIFRKIFVRPDLVSTPTLSFALEEAAPGTSLPHAMPTSYNRIIRSVHLPQTQRRRTRETALIDEASPLYRRHRLAHLNNLAPLRNARVTNVKSSKISSVFSLSLLLSAIAIASSQTQQVGTRANVYRDE
jgi:hypothetical protein